MKNRIELDGEYYTKRPDGYYVHIHKITTVTRKYLHRVIWEKHYGKIPDDMCIH